MICHNRLMCGRYRLSRRKQIIEEYFETAPWDDDWNPRYNIATTQPVPVIRKHPKEPVLQLSYMKWGLLPYWSKDPSIAASTINAKIGNCRHETCVSRSSEVPKVPYSRRWLLRVEENWIGEAALLLRSERRRAIRVCRIVGRLEELGGAVDTNVYDFDDDAKCR